MIDFEVLNKLPCRKLLSTMALSCAMVVSGCGSTSSDNESGNTPVDHFNLNTEEITKIDAATLTAEINGEALLGTVKIDELLKLVPEVPALSRMSNSEFRACVKKRLADVPLSVTTDTLSVQYDLDFIISCDEAAKPDDKVTELSNRLTGKLAVICQGAGFGQWEGRTWGEASNSSLVNACGSGRQIQFASSYAISARKIEKTKSRDDSEITTLAAHTERSSLTSLNGAPCALKLENRIWTLESCRKVSYTRQYKGIPDKETVSPNATDAAERPYVQQSEMIWADAKFLEGDRYFHAGNTSFNFGNWQGTLAYTNGWAAPKWSATRDADKAEGIFGQQAQRQ